MKSVIRRLWIQTLEAQLSVFLLERASLADRIDQAATPEERLQLSERFDQVTKESRELETEIEQLKAQQARVVPTLKAVEGLP